MASARNAMANVEPQQAPRLAKRKQAFLDAADSIFREKGFAQTTLDDVIARSGGSRQTLYTIFGGKEGLFRAIVVERSRTIYAGVPIEESLTRQPEDALFDLGVRYLDLMFSPAAIGHYRMVMSEGIRFPEIAQAYWIAGPEHNLGRLAKYFAEQVKTGTLILPDPMAAAHHYWGMLQGRIFLQVALGLRARPTHSEIETIVRGAMTQFLQGCSSTNGIEIVDKSAIGKRKRTEPAKAAKASKIKRERS